MYLKFHVVIVEVQLHPLRPRAPGLQNVLPSCPNLHKWLSVHRTVGPPIKYLPVVREVPWRRLTLYFGVDLPLRRLCLEVKEFLSPAMHCRIHSTVACVVLSGLFFAEYAVRGSCLSNLVQVNLRTSVPT